MGRERNSIAAAVDAGVDAAMRHIRKAMFDTNDPKLQAVEAAAQLQRDAGTETQDIQARDANIRGHQEMTEKTKAEIRRRGGKV